MVYSRKEGQGRTFKSPAMRFLSMEMGLTNKSKTNEFIISRGYAYGLKFGVMVYKSCYKKGMKTGHARESNPGLGAHSPSRYHYAIVAMILEQRSNAGREFRTTSECIVAMQTKKMLSTI